MMDRRTLLAGSVCLLGTPHSAAAQSAAKVPRVGFLCAVTCGESYQHIPGADPLPLGLFTEALQALGYEDGRNIKIEYAATDQGDPEQTRLQARNLVRRQVSMIFVAGGTVTALAAKDVAPAIPIVIAV